MAPRNQSAQPGKTLEEDAGSRWVCRPAKSRLSPQTAGKLHDLFAPAPRFSAHPPTSNLRLRAWGVRSSGGLAVRALDARWRHEPGKAAPRRRPRGLRAGLAGPLGGAGASRERHRRVGALFVLCIRAGSPARRPLRTRASPKGALQTSPALRCLRA